jgi:hypothetical protein
MACNVSFKAKLLAGHSRFNSFLFNFKIIREIILNIFASSESSGPVFIDIKNEPEAEHLPPVYSWHKAAKQSV